MYQTVFDFGTIQVNIRNALNTFTITNSDEDSTGVLSSSLLGTSNNQFNISSDTCNGMNLAPFTS
jgi:hypothetical protein